MRSLTWPYPRSLPTRLLLAAVLLLALVTACSDSEGDEGSRCDQDGDCATDFCLREVGVDEGLCASASADIDGDGLSNSDELLLGTSPMRRDSDQDGIPDGDEAEDCDGDGRPDALESGRSDADGDGVPDPYDQDHGEAFCGAREVPVAGPIEGGCVAYTCRLRLTCDGGEREECPAGQRCVEGLSEAGELLAFCEPGPMPAVAPAADAGLGSSPESDAGAVPTADAGDAGTDLDGSAP